MTSSLYICCNLCSESLLDIKKLKEIKTLKNFVNVSKICDYHENNEINLIDHFLKIFSMLKNACLRLALPIYDAIYLAKIAILVFLQYEIKEDYFFWPPGIVR